MKRLNSIPLDYLYGETLIVALRMRRSFSLYIYRYSGLRGWRAPLTVKVVCGMALPPKHEAGNHQLVSRSPGPIYTTNELSTSNTEVAVSAIRRRGINARSV